jgi:hypothetical protein
MRICYRRSCTFASSGRGSATGLCLLVSAMIALGAATPRPLNAQGTRPTAGQAPPSVVNGTATLLGHYSPNQMLRLVIGLQHPHPDEERHLIDELHDKKSPLFHQFLTPD